MEVLVLDGKNYVKAAKAARDLGYATDYVGQLCRTGQVDAHLIGRTWYVNQEQLGTHRVEKKRMSRTKAREQARQMIAISKKDVASHKNSINRNIAISYETDASPLIPTTRKVAIVSEFTGNSIDSDESEETVIENKGEKVLMSGDLTVVDITDGPVEDDTTILKPKIIRSRAVDHIETVRRPLTIQTDYEEADASEESQTAEYDSVSDDHEVLEKVHQPQAFIDRVQKPALRDTQQDTLSAPIQGTHPLTDAQENVEKSSYFIHIAIQLLLILSMFASFATMRVFTYDSSRIVPFVSSFEFSVADGINALSGLAR